MNTPIDEISNLASYSGAYTTLMETHTVKRYAPLLLFLTFLTLAPALIYSSIEDGDWGPHDIQDEEPTGPFYFNADFDHIFNSHFTKSGFKCEEIDFDEGSIELGAVFYYDPCFKEGATAALAYTFTHLGWKNNPNFKKQDFNTASLELRFFTGRFLNWIWITQFGINIDTDHFNIDKYATYDIFMWGRYLFCNYPEVGVHVGFYAPIGMRMDRVYPVLGFDWQYSEKWKFNAIYPFDINVVYEFNKCWSANAGVRFWYSRHRAGSQEPVPMALFQYMNAGAEAAIDYALGERIKANAHIGYTFGGKVKLANRNNRKRRRFRFDPAPYVGGEIRLQY